ncbi:hypothetical protein HDZ31DRAFT_77123 [Schizophyllum fasciatum]
MCGYSVMVTNETNICGNHNVVIGDYDDPQRVEPPRFIEPEGPYCQYHWCRYQKVHRQTLNTQAHCCDKQGCPKGPYIGTLSMRSDGFTICGLVSCETCKGGYEVQRCLVYAGPRFARGWPKPCTPGNCHCLRRQS